MVTSDSTAARRSSIGQAAPPKKVNKPKPVEEVKEEEKEEFVMTNRGYISIKDVKIGDKIETIEDSKKHETKVDKYGPEGKTGKELGEVGEQQPLKPHVPFSKSEKEIADEKRAAEIAKVKAKRRKVFDEMVEKQEEDTQTGLPQEDIDQLLDAISRGEKDPDIEESKMLEKLEDNNIKNIAAARAAAGIVKENRSETVDRDTETPKQEIDTTKVIADTLKDISDTLKELLTVFKRSIGQK